jgi:hypothetical protein
MVTYLVGVAQIREGQESAGVRAAPGTGGHLVGAGAGGRDGERLAAVRIPKEDVGALYLQSLLMALDVGQENCQPR